MSGVRFEGFTEDYLFHSRSHTGSVFTQKHKLSDCLNFSEFLVNNRRIFSARNSRVDRNEWVIGPRERFVWPNLGRWSENLFLNSILMFDSFSCNTKLWASLIDWVIMINGSDERANDIGVSSKRLTKNAQWLWVRNALLQFNLHRKLSVVSIDVKRNWNRAVKFLWSRWGIVSISYCLSCYASFFKEQVREMENVH